MNLNFQRINWMNQLAWHMRKQAVFSFARIYMPKSTAAALMLLAFAMFSGHAHSQATFICQGEDGVPEYTQNKKGKQCKLVKLPEISYGSSNVGSSLYKSSTKALNYVRQNYAKKPSNSNIPPPPVVKNNPNGPLFDLPKIKQELSASTEIFGGLPSTLPKNMGSDRKSILQNEMSVKQRVLADLQKNFNNGQPERLGNEKNYQNYLDRVDQMRKQINRTQGDIQALQKEMQM